MAHYVCTGGCGGEKDRPGVCETEDCSKEGQPMTECNCIDGGHDEVSTSSGETSEDNE